MSTRFNEIENRAKKATPGKWKVYKTGDGVCIGTEGNHQQLNAPSPVVSMGIRIKEPSHHIYISDEDADFIAHSRDDISFLLKEVERLEGELKNSVKVTVRGNLPVGPERGGKGD